MTEDPSALPPTILLVDDDPRNLLALESLLESDEFRVAKAQTSDEALLALMHGEFAAIVLDVEMPEVNGIELARLIKQRRRTQHIPVIFLTAHYREEEHAMLAYEVGAVDYLTKPINPAVLRSKVNVFVELFQKTRALAAVNVQLEAQNTALQREAEERSRRIQAEAGRAEAEAANAAKDRFLAMLSHELRTPLTPIIYAVSLLEKDHAVPAHVREALEIIQRNVWLEARLIDDLLDLARIRSGKLTLLLQTIDAHQVLVEAAKICANDIARRKINLVQNHEAGRASLNADPARLQQVFWNLLANAAKFTPEGGTISVRTSIENDGSTFRVDFSDTGVGIEPQKLNRIFDAFEQGEQNSSAGLGLGLAICKALVDLHGGRIEAQSAGPGSGSCFTIALPLSVSVPAAASGVPPLEPVESGALRILLVEDHRDTAETLRRLLTRRGYEVRTAGSVAEALHLATTFIFDVLVSDIGLPDGRGTELLGRLQRQVDRPIRAVAMSGFGMEDDIERSRQAGFADHLTKPVDFGELERAISHLAADIALPSPS